jgi:hypothetical protein
MAELTEFSKQLLKGKNLRSNYSGNNLKNIFDKPAFKL